MIPTEVATDRATKGDAMQWTVKERTPSGPVDTRAGSEQEAWKIADDINRRRDGKVRIEIYNEVGIIASVDDVKTRLQARNYPGSAA
jgi:hypothetical protein